MAAKKIANGKTRIDAHRHADKRKNIPTEELRDFVAAEEGAPPAMLYPRDPSLDPQLVWKGKDEQDRAALEVPTVPIYIQEKIHPQALIEDFRSTAARTENDGPDLFADFNGLPADFDKRVDFYHYDGHWQNRLILGDSLLVMNSLAEKEGLKGKVQMIYFDPPYGIKFGSNWQVSTRKRDVKDGKAEDMSLQPEQIKAFRDTWELGIHSYLAYLRDRLTVARELLTESGSIFLQIGDENYHLVRSLLDEVFGSENCVASIGFVKTAAQSAELLPCVCDYVVWYSKSKEHLKYRQIYRDKTDLATLRDAYSWVKSKDGEIRRASEPECSGQTPLPDGSLLFRLSPTTSQRPPGSFPVVHEGHKDLPGKQFWKTHQAGFDRLLKAQRLQPAGNTLFYRLMLQDFPCVTYTNLWSDTQASFGDKIYIVQTATKVIQRCLLMSTDPGDLVLDPTCGSGTTAIVAEQWGRRWITTDTSRVAITLARMRLTTARFPYYLLADSPEGQKKEAELSGRAIDPKSAVPGEDIRNGFVYKRVPHVMLGSVANNEEIDTIHAAYQTKLEPIRQRLNTLLKQNWEEFEYARGLPISKDVPKKSGDEAAEIYKKYCALRRERQREIDASIARRADTELLFDQPYEDAKRVRVTGPFTVESLSPHRTISVEDKKKLADVGDKSAGVKIKTVGPDPFGHMILENLKTTPLMGQKGDRVTFQSVEPYPGQWIQGEGIYADADGKERRAAICIGPEHGTIGPELIKEAAKEAVRGVGFDLLLVLGFAFDPHVAEEAKRYGKLTVLPVRLNPDLMMGKLLKQSKAANLFMVFGEPDIEIKKQKDGQITVTIHGLDLYDPNTGEIRSSGSDEIACWFLDTNYNGESFFVRHAYFTGANEPYEKLKRALRAEIDEAAWSALYKTTSRPFPAPKSGKLAVKVINHYGDEVLKVYKCG